MKAYLLVVALAVIPACSKKNDAHILHHEAVTLVKYYQPQLDALDRRVQEIFKRGTTIPGNLPGIQDVGLRLQEARDSIVKLRATISPQPGGDQKSAVEKQADAAAKANNVVELQKLVHDTEVALDQGITVIRGNLDTVEAWIEQYDRKTLALNAPAATEPGTPEAQSTPQTGQPPAGAQPGSAQPTGTEPPKAPTPAGKAPTPEQPKAPAKAAAPAQPKAPAAAQPKQPQK